MKGVEKKKHRAAGLHMIAERILERLKMDCELYEI